MRSAAHKIIARHSGVLREDRLSIPLIKRSVIAALVAQGVDVPCEVSVLVTNDEGIREINRDFRSADKPTDVLSFPMHEFTPGEFDSTGIEIDRDTGRLPLGDIVLSAERVREQARQYGSTSGRETAYLVVHSVLHLLGYDHINEADDKKKMRTREKEIMRLYKE